MVHRDVFCLGNMFADDRLGLTVKGGPFGLFRHQQSIHSSPDQFG